MTEQRCGTVVKIDGGTAVVRFKRTKACGQCKACFTLGSEEADIEMENTLNASVGDVVEIELRERSMVKASLIMYGIPLLGLIAGTLLGALISEIAAAVCGVALALLVYCAIHLLEPRFRKKKEFRPQMKAFAEKSGGEATKD
ncbi:MAG: SoxR reducing system RseC family protein [Eubacteriales bacterium]|jgi:sigma-E factor negative regulatory protein RseC|nr:SoxR reducing system RseC family protein [Eubacteriales bacterium]MCI6029333.1 SoxR reducing system RseC family protein [Clostridiales bacterium]